MKQYTANRLYGNVYLVTGGNNKSIIIHALTALQAIKGAKQKKSKS